MPTVVALTTLASPALADDVDAFDVRWEIDLPVTAAAAITGGAMFILKDELVPEGERCAPACDRDAINGFDATVRGRYSAGAHTAGNVLVSTSIALGPAVALLGALGSDHPDRWQHALEDVALVAEVLGVSVMVHQITAFATRRPRPYAYGTTAPLETRTGPDAYLSFYSGHTANAFAVASATSYLFMRRHPDSPWALPLWTFSHGLAAWQGASRVMAGYHFWTDVLVGAFVGEALGLAIPALHETGSDLPTVTAAPTTGGATLQLRSSW